ncbi:MAG: glycosyltransferase family 2 protein [Chitinophagales bacterium]|nr:glycosyltransferase family 2 protein [Chitinophagales bacterium]
METLLWISIAALAFIYVGYGILITVLNKLLNNKPQVTTPQTYPSIAILIAAYNEEEVIDLKLQNTTALDYQGSVTVYVISDGSTDNTNQIVGNHPQVTLLWQAARRGKSAAINRAMPFIKEEITVFTDANVMLEKNALIALAQSYNNDKVGGVSGEKVVEKDDRAAAASTEGAYWKYESFLKRQDARLYSIAGAAGELFSIRTHLFQAIPEDTLLDDFIIAMNIIKQGYTVKYAPEAKAVEKPSFDIEEEYKRKVRIAAGGLQASIRCAAIMNPFIYGIFAFQFIVHRVSRWTVAPLFILLAFISNVFLLGQGSFYQILLLLQLSFHLAALAGWYFNTIGKKVKLLYIPFYFDFMHYCVVLGWIRYLKGNQSAAWQKATRLSYS